MKKVIFTLILSALINAAYTQNSLPNLIKSKGGLSQSATTLSDAEQVAFNPQKAAVTFGLNPSSDLKFQKAEPDNLGYTHYRYYQTYKEIPVENAMYIVHVKADKLSGMNGEIVTEFDADMEARSIATINAKHAISTVINYLKATKYAWQDEEMENALKTQKADQ